MSARSWLYRIARALGDVNAVRRGTVPKRLLRRAVGHVVGRLLRAIFR